MDICQSAILTIEIDAMNHPTSSLEHYLYELPDKLIAKHPLQDRSASKLLLMNGEEISDERFENICQLIPKDALLFFNNTKVINARMIFHKDTGARIEIFLTEPVAPSEIQLALSSEESCTWKCIVGNSKKWKDDQKLQQTITVNNISVCVTAELVDRTQGYVKFTWTPKFDFSTIVELIGSVPLPPYLNREAQKEDENRYQTVFSELDGAVAAPTAGLHFTKEIIDQLSVSGLTVDYLTLHVSAGTFKPIKEDDFTHHPMHNEKIIVSKVNIENILKSKGHVIPVGTTALRTLESLYWFGVKLIESPTASFHIYKNDPYVDRSIKDVSSEMALNSVLNHMEKHGLSEVRGETEIFIYPGYDFKICTGLFTNFHQPGSTLILLVAAFMGEVWKKMYDHAKAKNYRFLSYGDTSLLLPKKK